MCFSNKQCVLFYFYSLPHDKNYVYIYRVYCGSGVNFFDPMRDGLIEHNRLLLLFYSVTKQQQNKGPVRRPSVNGNIIKG